MSIVHTNDKWINLDSLPKLERNTYIDWKNSIGMKVPFHYANLDGEIEITSYEKDKKVVHGKYLDNEFKQSATKFRKCEILELYWLSDRFRYKVGDIVKDDKRDFTILDRFYKLEKNEKYPRPYYKCKCNKDNHEFSLMEKFIFGNHHSGCPLCSNRTVVKELNSLHITDPWMIPYFKNVDDTYKYTRSSNQKTKMICPNCGKERIYAINDLCNKGYLPCSCGDGWSYPNKFMYKLFSNLNINFTSEKHFKWAGKKAYDTYIELDNGKKVIVEAHGIQHYKDVEGLFESYEYQVENDKSKKDLALKHGIDYYFEIDCRKSNINWIKENVVSSGLLKLLNVEENDINWIECGEFAESNLTKIICDFAKNNCHLSRTEIYKKLNLSRNAVILALQRGQKLNWISGEAIKSIDENGKNVIKNSKSNPLYNITLDMYFYSVPAFIEWYNNQNVKKIKTSHIYDCLNNKRNFAHGMKYERITKEEFNNKKMESPNKCVGDFLLSKKKGGRIYAF